MMNLCYGCMQPRNPAFEVCPHCGYIAGTAASDPHCLQPGTMVSHYLVGKVMGIGGRGATYIAFDTRMKQRVALKEYMPFSMATRVPGVAQVAVYQGADASQFQRGKAAFLEEARWMAQFANEPVIANVLDAFDANGTSYSVQAYLEGEHLSDVLRQQGNMTPEEAMNIMGPVLDALNVVHAAGYVHGDVCPRNIFLCSDGNVRLLNFESAYNNRSGVTINGNPGYTPPEQYQGAATSLSDVYACAATLYKMITGVTPEEAPERLTKDALVKPSKLEVKIGRSSENALMKGMSLDPQMRPQSAAELKSQLSGMTVPVAGGTRSVSTTKPAEGLKLWQKLVLAGAGVVMLGLSIGIGATVTYQNGRRAQYASNFHVDNGQIKVPDIRGLTEEEARAKLEAVGLVLSTDGGVAFNSQIKADVIMDQDLNPGTPVDPGTTVTVTLCLGARPVTMPDVVGLNFTQGESILRERGINDINYTGTGTRIIEQKPDRWTEVSTDVTVTLTLGDHSERTYVLYTPKWLGIENYNVLADMEIMKRVIDEDDHDPNNGQTSGDVVWDWWYRIVYIDENDSRNMSNRGILVGAEYKGETVGPQQSKKLEISDPEYNVLILYVTSGYSSPPVPAPVDEDTLATIPQATKPVETPKPTQAPKPVETQKPTQAPPAQTTPQTTSPPAPQAKPDEDYVDDPVTPAFPELDPGNAPMPRPNEEFYAD